LIPNTQDAFVDWRDFDNGGDDQIDPGKAMHVGFNIHPGPSTQNIFKDMFWTDAQHNRIPGSIIYDSTPLFTYTGPTRVAHITWSNAITPGVDLPRQVMHIDQVFWALVDQPQPLANLNSGNGQLQNILQAWLLPSGVPLAFSLQVGQAQTWDLPVPAGPSQRLILRYTLSADGSAAQLVDFVQSDPMEPKATPALGGSSLAAMAVILLGAGLVAASWRRRQLV
jgi:hypothetical protein